MSGSFVALLQQESGYWNTALEKLSRSLVLSESDVRNTIVLRKLSGFSRSQFDDPETVYQGILSCSYSRPISLNSDDAGPFVSGSDIALVYDGIISGISGQGLADHLSGNGLIGLLETSRKLNGQFSLLVLYRRRPDRIYYAAKAKPLYLLFDGLRRGIVISSSRESLNGMYHPVRDPQPVEIRPYSCGYVTVDGVVVELGTLDKVVGDGTLILSGGGLDTLVAAYAVKHDYPTERMRLIYFDYGAKASMQEVIASRVIAKSLDAECHYVDLSFFPDLVNSTLTDKDGKVVTDPQPGKASEWVPARNTVFMSLALSAAESQNFVRIVTGINKDAATAYPDNDEEWNRRFQSLAAYALGNGRKLSIEAPLSQLNKVEIVKLGDDLGIPWREVRSWSCYDNGELHCGKCSSCRARRKAFRLAEVIDHTEYAE